jgi:hypothetical protein
LIQIYHKIGKYWAQIFSPIHLNLAGYVRRVDVGNFDTDSAQEIVVGSWVHGELTHFYLLNFDSIHKYFESKLIYELNAFISDLNIIQASGNTLDGVLILYIPNLDVADELLTTNVLRLTAQKNGKFVSTLIYSEKNIYWNLMSTGTYFSTKQDEEQIVLHRYQSEINNIDQSIMKIINVQGETITDQIVLNEHKNVADIIAWDIDNDGFEELSIMESNHVREQNVYVNEMTYYKINPQGISDYKKITLHSNQWLTQMKVGDLDRAGNKLVILDPPAGVLPYLRAFDDEAYSFYESVGYGTINARFDAFEEEYELGLNIDTYRVADTHYTSSGSRASSLFTDLKNKIESLNMRDTFNVEEVIGVIFDQKSWRDYFVYGIGSEPGKTAAVFGGPSGVHYHPSWRTICHEVGHNYGLDHCPNIGCLMYFAYSSTHNNFCSNCKNWIIPYKTKFGAPIIPNNAIPYSSSPFTPTGSYYDGYYSDLWTIDNINYVWRTGTIFWGEMYWYYGFSVKFTFPENLFLDTLEIDFSFGLSCKVTIKWDSEGSNYVWTTGSLIYDCDGKSIEYIIIEHTSVAVPCPAYVYFDEIRIVWDGFVQS